MSDPEELIRQMGNPSRFPEEDEFDGKEEKKRTARMFIKKEDEEFESSGSSADEDDPATAPEEFERVTTRIKLEAPCMYEKFSKRVYDTQNEHLKEVLEDYKIKIEDEYVEEGDDSELAGTQRYHTTTYKISCRHFNTQLMKAVRQFFYRIKEMDALPHVNPTLMLPTAEALSNALVMSHSDVATRSIFFGNVQGGAYFSHWEVTLNEASNSLFTHFEYDRNDIIAVKFHSREEIREGQGRVYVKMYYEIFVSRSSIRRIVVDNAVSDKSGANRTRLHLELNYPPIIKNGYWKNENNNNKHSKPNMQRRTSIKHGVREGQFCKDAAISDSPFFSIEFDRKIEMPIIYAILSRLRARCGVQIEFAYLPIVNCWVWQHTPYFTWDVEIRDGRAYDSDRPTSDRNPLYEEFLNYAMPRNTLAPPFEQDEMRRKRFIITYLIECLLSRGAVVKDQLCLQYRHWFNFLRIITSQIKRNFDRCERALEKLVVMIDERKRIGSIHKALVEIFEQMRKSDDDPALTPEEKRDGYQRVRKIIITTTRMIYVVPEMMMSNRVLRRYDEYGINVLRVSFRDDDNVKMRSTRMSDALIDMRVKKYLVHGFYLAGKQFGYLGSSNSQMRDHGAYFMQKNAHWDVKDWQKENKAKGQMPPPSYMAQIYRVRRELGKFESIESVPKLMARLGQCFTQSRESGVKLEKGEYCTTYDAIGGVNSQGNEFTFSDGVGCISKERAQKIARDMNLGKGCPTCYQFRFRGMKGVIAINPELDEIAAWATASKLEPPTGGDVTSWKVHFVFRDSQIKFKGAIQQFVEVVKCASPSPVSLNKPFINILDQASEMQGHACHKRVTDRIEQLLDRQMRGFATQMIDEHQCRNRLKELPRRVDIDAISQKAGFELSREPFFRSLIKAAVKYSITKQLRKEQIQIPFEKGRTMLGVVDESNQLQYGQVFVQFTKTIRDKFPPPGAAKEVLTGRVLLTKNPCIVEGDVRMFEAVDIPQLHHLVDVIVFPKHGHRPHPDEMAGSDLDGDEYCVIWDQDLFLRRNEAPFDFAVPKRLDINVMDGLQEKMAEFYVKYMKLDAVGTISNAFLFQSDLYGITHPICQRLAKKNCEAVDFTKSGMAPENLTTKWDEDADGKDIPPEKPERNPDFHFGENGKPMYESRRIIGRLYREIKTIEDVMRIAEDHDEQMVIEIDELLVVDGWEKYRESASEELGKYNTLLRTLMETYGIRTEAEVITGYICEMRNRISDKDQDDMSFFNTNQVIETRVTGLFKRFRQEFFEEFGGWKAVLTKSDKQFADENNVCHYEMKDPSTDMQKKAVAYYRLCYERAKETGEKKLSFGWLAYDILAHVKQQAVITEALVVNANPLWVTIENHMTRYIEENAERFQEFHDFCYGKSEVSTAIEPLQKYCWKYEGLDRILFMITEWGTVANLYTTHFKRAHLALLAILYYTNSLNSLDGDALVLIEPIPIGEKKEGIKEETEKKDGNEEEKPVERVKLARPEQTFVKFFEFMSSRKFNRLKYISYQPLGFHSLFSRGEWIPLHRTALKTYYNLVFNLRFEELLLNEEKEAFANVIIRECEPFTIELPDKASIPKIIDKLISKTGIKEVQLRRQNNNRVLISARGTLESLDRLRKLTATKPPMNSAASGKEISGQLINLVFEKIMNDRKYQY